MPPSSKNTGFDSDPRKPLAMRLWDGLCGLLAFVHAFLAKYLSQGLGWLWRKQSRIPLGVRFGIGFLGLAAIMAVFAYALPGRYVRWCEFDEAQVRYLQNAGTLSTGRILSLLAWASAGLSALAALLAFVRKPFSLWVLKIAWAFYAVVSLFCFRWLMAAPSVLYNADYKSFDKGMRNELWNWAIFGGPLSAVWPALILLALLALGVRRHYCGAAAPAPRLSSNPFIRNLQTGGADPRFRSSVYWAVWLFLAVIVGPFLIRGCGTEEFGIVKGTGEPQVTQVQRIKPKPKKKKQKLLVDPWSPYILERIDIDDAKVLEELEQMTQDTYVTDRTSGKLGKGGWPKGMEGAKVRFIRLKYNGGNWDQEMGKSGDFNLLVRFNQLTGLPIANETESREIERLAHFAKKKSPPFVFMTGSGNINISTREAKILRDYCEKEGGMLFIDCGGGHFGRSVRNMLSKVFPGKSLIDIPNDDPIYQAPFVFPDGAPPFWHHDGTRALGIRHEGRLMVFYSPGDVKDAWKIGHSGVTEEVADQAYKLGVNVIYYSYNQYYRRHYEQEE